MSKKIFLFLILCLLWCSFTNAEALDEDDFVPTDGTVSVDSNGDLTVSANAIAANAVDSSKIADGAVTSSKILDGSVTTAKITDQAIVSTKIANGAVLANAIASNAVNSSKIADGAVTSTKIANGAILAEDIAANVISQVGTKYLNLDVGAAVRSSLSLSNVGGGFSAAPVLQYDASGLSYGLWSLTMPDDWQAGTDINIELLWSPNNSSGSGTTVEWTVYYKVFTTDDIIPNSSSYFQNKYIQNTPNTALKLISTGNNLTLSSANLSADKMLNLVVVRDSSGGNSANDNYGNDANLHMVRVKYQAKKVN